MTSALTSVRFATSISCHMRSPSAAQRFTYSPRTTSGRGTSGSGVGALSGAARALLRGAERRIVAALGVVGCSRSPRAVSDATQPSRSVQQARVTRREIAHERKLAHPRLQPLHLRHRVHRVPDRRG